MTSLILQCYFGTWYLGVGKKLTFTGNGFFTIFQSTGRGGCWPARKKADGIQFQALRSTSDLTGQDSLVAALLEATRDKCLVSAIKSTKRRQSLPK